MLESNYVTIMFTKFRKNIFHWNRRMVSDQVQHKPDCTSTEESWKLETLNNSKGEIVLSVWRKQRR